MGCPASPSRPVVGSSVTWGGGHRNPPLQRDRRTDMKLRPMAMILSLLAFGAVGVAGAPPAYGCSCAQVLVDEAINEYTVAAFVGTPVSVSENAESGRISEDVYVQPLAWTFEIETVLYGEVPEVVEVGSGHGGGDSGYDLSNAGRIGVVAYGEPGALPTGICGAVWDADALIGAYGPGTDPIPVVSVPANPMGGSGPPGWFWWGLAGAGLGAVLLLVFGRRRGDLQEGWRADSAE